MANKRAADRREVTALTPERWALVADNLDLVAIVMLRWFRRGGWFRRGRWDDLYSAGQWGLVVAADAWVEGGGQEFRDFALFGVLREIQGECRRTVSWTTSRPGRKRCAVVRPRTPAARATPREREREWSSAVARAAEADHLRTRLGAVRAVCSARQWEWLCAVHGIGRDPETGAAVAARAGVSGALVSLEVVAARAKARLVLSL